MTVLYHAVRAFISGSMALVINFLIIFLLEFLQLYPDELFPYSRSTSSYLFVYGAKIMWWYTTAFIFSVLYVQFYLMRFAVHKNVVVKLLNMFILSHLFIGLVWGLSFVQHYILLSDIDIAVLICMFLENYVPLVVSAFTCMLLTRTRGSEMLNHYQYQIALLYKYMQMYKVEHKDQIEALKSIVTQIPDRRTVPKLQSKID